MVDLGPLFAIAESLVDGAVDTSGTTTRVTRSVDVSREADETLALVATPLPTTIKASEPAIIITPGAGQDVGFPGVVAQPGDVRIVWKASFTTVLEGDQVYVPKSRDPRLVGRTYRVKALLDASAGAARVALAEPVRLGASA